MSNLLTPADIEALARRYGLSLRDLCREAEVPLSVFYKWRGGHCDVMTRTYDKLLTAVNKAEEAFDKRAANGTVWEPK